MPWMGKRADKDDESEKIVFDDGGSGLFNACTDRFGKFGWDIECDAHHAVWVRNPATSYAVGLGPWILGRHSLDEALKDVETKMRDAQSTLTA